MVKNKKEKKTKKGISKQTILIILLFITIGIVSYAVLFFLKSNSLLKFENDDIHFSYDSSWSASRVDNSIYLTKKNGSSITISIVEKTDELMNMSIDEINSSVIADLMKKNEDYKKIVDTKMKLTSVYYDGYKTLFENKTSESLVFVVSANDSVLIINYSAKNKYFDMSLDSVESIVGSIVI